jgi:hypothetical protein
MQPAALEALDSSTLAQLLYRMALNVKGGIYHPPSILDVRQGGVGSTGGFTFALHSVSEQQGERNSPWVEVGGIGWRIKVYPKGLGEDAHLSGESRDRGRRARCTACGLQCAQSS